jgi:hypothetical protein
MVNFLPPMFARSSSFEVLSVSRLTFTLRFPARRRKPPLFSIAPLPLATSMTPPPMTRSVTRRPATLLEPSLVTRTSSAFNALKRPRESSRRVVPAAVTSAPARATPDNASAPRANIASASASAIVDRSSLAMLEPPSRASDGLHNTGG